MVDVNVNSDVKGYGVPVAPAQQVKAEDRVKPQVPPVQKGDNQASAALDEERLHRKEGRSQAGKKLTQEELEENIAEIQDRLDAIGSNLLLGFAKEEKFESVVVQVKERQTGELVRQIPSEEVLELRKKLEEVAGLLFDKKA